MSITPEIEADILRHYRANPKRFSPFKVSKQVGATLREVIDVVNANESSLNNGNEHSGGKGREDLQPFIVASRRVGQPWPDVSDARAKFCAGTHTMATHRDGAWQFLCLFPLNWPTITRHKYFEGACG